MKKVTITALAMVLGFTLSTPAFACKGAGENAHMGVITAINLKDKTVTLKDAETGQSITFKAAETLLKSVKASDRAMISYKTEGKDLIAEKIKV
ncbi:MAG: hypothetical protein HYR79_04325 [Nitrospirae bacterium]|nr:hypothetical protein [Nitrospirota bacterium]